MFIYRAKLRAHSNQGSQQSTDVPDQPWRFARVQARSWIPAPYTVESVFWLSLTRRAGNFWKLCGPVVLELRGGKPEADCSKGKASTRCEDFPCDAQTRQLIQSLGKAYTQLLLTGDPVWEIQSSLEWPFPLPPRQEYWDIAPTCCGVLHPIWPEGLLRTPGSCLT